MELLFINAHLSNFFLIFSIKTTKELREQKTRMIAQHTQPFFVNY